MTNSEQHIDIDKKFVLKKLFTYEDKHYFHKTFGLLSLLNFIYRYAYLLSYQGNLGIRNDISSYVVLFLHIILSYSSLIFRVLKNRLKIKGLIIWEEYRLHAIVFTSRAIIASIYGIIYDFIIRRIGYNNGQILLTIIMLSHLLIVDKITNKYGTENMTTVRFTNNYNLPMKYAALLYSYYQFCATASVLRFNPKLSDMGFNTLIAIQMSAFLMTLNKKNFIKWYVHSIFYSLCLIISGYYMYKTYGCAFFIEVFGLFLFRINFNANKYLLWSIYSLLQLSFN